MSTFKPSRSLNNKGLFLGLELPDFIFLIALLLILRFIIPLDDYLLIHLCFVIIVGAGLSAVKLRFRKGFIFSYFLGKAISLKEKVKSYVF